MYLENRISATDEFNSFDELVLNPDTRKFLYDMIEEDHPGSWQKRTCRSYALSEPHRAEWRQIGQPLTDAEVRQFDDLRWALLQMMTNPEKHLDESKTIGTFLSLCSRPLHPRFLMYNFEAVAIYWLWHRGEARAKELRERFERVLRETIRECERNLQKADSPLWRAWSLLFLKCIDIAVRISFPWVREYGNEKRIDQLRNSFLDNPEHWAPTEKALKKADDPLLV